MSINADRKRLSQAHILAEMQRELKSNDMITVYQVDKDIEEHSKRYIFCALIPSSHIQDSLADSTWDLEFSDGMPSGVTYHKQGESLREYLRYGVDNGVEPLILVLVIVGGLVVWLESGWLNSYQMQKAGFGPSRRKQKQNLRNSLLMLMNS
ncbi:hypothetical protein C6501_19170 [Candidatus Poribacteria bacterium]|nr:MAG: hypothetical protein C6501_19170 [Candidatus Poribacteria bacterium]